jgi:hypothetical protein
MRDAVLRDRLVYTAISALAVALLSGAYLLLALLWISAQADLDEPSYVLNGPLREFFRAALIAAGVAGAASLAALRPTLRCRPALRRLMMTSGALMVATGVAGILIVLPATATLSSSGGLNPDFGHVLTWDNFTGALWLFLLTGAIPYALGFFGSPRPRPLASAIGLIATAAPPLWYIAMALVDRWQDITAP